MDFCLPTAQVLATIREELSPHELDVEDAVHEYQRVRHRDSQHLADHRQQPEQLHQKHPRRPELHRH